MHVLRFDSTTKPSQALGNGFMKSNFYSWQEEVRIFFYFHADQFPDYITIEAGPISDICEFVNPSQTAAENRSRAR